MGGFAHWIKSAVPNSKSMNLWSMQNSDYFSDVVSGTPKSSKVLQSLERHPLKYISMPDQGNPLVQTTGGLWILGIYYSQQMSKWWHACYNIIKQITGGSFHVPVKEIEWMMGAYLTMQQHSGLERRLANFQPRVLTMWATVFPLNHYLRVRDSARIWRTRRSLVVHPTLFIHFCYPNSFGPEANFIHKTFCSGEQISMIKSVLEKNQQLKNPRYYEYCFIRNTLALLFHKASRSLLR